MKIRMEEDILSGTGAEIMDHLRARVFDPTEFPDTESYIWCVPPAWTSRCQRGMWSSRPG